MYYNRRTITKSITVIIYLVFFIFLGFCNVFVISVRILYPAGVIMSACGCYMWNLLYLHGFVRFLLTVFLPHYLYCMWDFMVYDRVFEIGRWIHYI